MRSTVQRQLAAGATLVLAAIGAGCGLPGGEPPEGDLIISSTSVSSSCENDHCTGELEFTVTNPQGNPATTEEPVSTVDPDSGTAIRSDAESDCDSAGTLQPGESCTEVYELESNDGDLTGTISVDAGNLQGSDTYSAA